MLYKQITALHQARKLIQLIKGKFIFSPLDIKNVNEDNVNEA
jgi:hypothetical protein